jgi:hypothetical protein
MISWYLILYLPSTHLLNESVEQFSSLLSSHPEYALIFHECQYADVSSSRAPAATYSAMNGNSNYNNSDSQSMMEANDVTMTSCDSHVTNRRQVRPTPSVHVCTPLRPRSKELCSIH